MPASLWKPPVVLRPSTLRNPRKFICPAESSSSFFFLFFCSSVGFSGALFFGERCSVADAVSVVAVEDGAVEAGVEVAASAAAVVLGASVAAVQVVAVQAVVGNSSDEARTTGNRFYPATSGFRQE